MAATCYECEGPVCLYCGECHDELNCYAATMPCDEDGLTDDGAFGFFNEDDDQDYAEVLDEEDRAYEPDRYDDVDDYYLGGDAYEEFRYNNGE